MAKRWLVTAFLLILFVAAWWAQAQSDAPAKSGRVVYVVKQGSAKELGSVLGKHFKGDVEALPDPTGSVLLISAPSPLLDEVIKLLGQIDRRPRLVVVEVLIADVVQKKPERAEPEEKGLDERELTGSIPDVLSRVEALQKKGRLSGLKRVQISAVEGLPATASMGESKPFASGVAGGAAGKTSRLINYRDTGTLLKLTPRVVGEKTVQMDINVSDSRLHVPENGVKIGVDENGAPVFATEFTNAQLTTTLNVPSGQAVAATGTKTSSPSGQVQRLVIVAARIVEPESK